MANHDWEGPQPLVPREPSGKRLRTFVGRLRNLGGRLLPVVSISSLVLSAIWFGLLAIIARGLVMSFASIILAIVMAVLAGLVVLRSNRRARMMSLAVVVPLMAATFGIISSIPPVNRGHKKAGGRRQPEAANAVEVESDSSNTHGAAPAGDLAVQAQRPALRAPMPGIPPNNTASWMATASHTMDANKVVLAAPTVELRLNGVFGGAHPLAIINHHTFEVGEAADLMSPEGPARVRCLEIHAEAVLVQVGGERRLLSMRSGL